MSDIKISLDSSGPNNEISVVRVDGVIDTMTATDLEKVMNSLLERHRYNIIIDLGGVDYISSAGWGIFISNIREIRQHTGDIKLARMIPNVYEIFELLEFDSILRAFDTVEKARVDFDGLKKSGGAGAMPVSVDTSSKVSPREIEPRPVEAKLESVIPIEESTRRIKTADAKPKALPLRLTDVIIEMISKDPFLSISEIKRELARKHPNFRAGWWKIWGILKQEKLLSRKNRFRRARVKAGEN